MLKNNKIFETKQSEGMERAAAFVIIPTSSGNVILLCYTWGRLEGTQFFDTVDGRHVELHGDSPFIIQCPQPGKTFNADGSIRDVQEEEKLVTLQ